MTDQDRQLNLGRHVRFDGREFTLTGGSRIRGVSYYTFNPVDPQADPDFRVHIMADEFWPKVDKGEITIL